MAKLEWTQGFAGHKQGEGYHIGIAEVDAASDELLTRIAAEVAEDAPVPPSATATSVPPER